MLKSPKYNIICGDGTHRTYTAALAEIIMLNKYGNQQDYFWRLSDKYDEYVRLIKLAGKISKEIGKDRFAFFLYKNQKYNFNTDIGLLIYNVKLDKNFSPEFSLSELIQVYKNKYRLQENKTEVKKDINAPKKNTTIRDFLGDV